MNSASAIVSGSEKQNLWATEIRAALLSAIAAVVARPTAHAEVVASCNHAVALFGACSNAKIFIDYKTGQQSVMSTLKRLDGAMAAEARADVSEAVDFGRRILAGQVA